MRRAGGRAGHPAAPRRRRSARSARSAPRGWPQAGADRPHRLPAAARRPRLRAPAARSCGATTRRTSAGRELYPLVRRVPGARLPPSIWTRFHESRPHHQSPPGPTTPTSPSRARCAFAAKTSRRARPSRSPTAGTTRTAWCWAGAWRTSCASPSATGTASSGTAPIRSATPLPAPVARAAAIRCSRRCTRPTSPSSCSGCCGVPFFTFHDRDIAPEGRDAGRIERQRAPHRRGASSARWHEHRREAAVGHGEPVLATAATWPARRPTPTPRCSPTPRRR